MLVTSDSPISLTEVRLPAIAPIPETVPQPRKPSPVPRVLRSTTSSRSARKAEGIWKSRSSHQSLS